MIIARSILHIDANKRVNQFAKIGFGCVNVQRHCVNGLSLMAVKPPSFLFYAFGKFYRAFHAQTAKL
jgi:hypothetical protein